MGRASSGSLVAVMLLAGCATAPDPAAEGYAVGGKLNLGRGQILVTINGETAAQGPLWLRRRVEPFGPGGLVRSTPQPFPLRGSYQGRPVEVECEKQPLIGEPVCDVELDGRHIATLEFNTEGLAGTFAEDAE